jgi:putative SOS response-associated peptidase YedK
VGPAYSFAGAEGTGLDEIPDEPGDDLCPQSLQPVIFTNDQGERQIELMRWAFQLPDKLLFNARSEGIEHAKFWKDAFLTGRCIVPGDALYEWQETEKGKKKPPLLSVRRFISYGFCLPPR